MHETEPERAQYRWLEREIDAGATILTASRRLARELRLAYDDRQTAAGRVAWRTPPIASLADWLVRLADQIPTASGLPARLDTVSGNVLWARCVAALLPEPVLGVGGVVRHTMKAWSLVQEWRLPMAELQRTARTAEQRLFASVAARYGEQLDAGDWMDRAQVLGRYGREIAQLADSTPAKLVFAGFDRPTPAVLDLIDAFRERGTECVVQPAPRYAEVPELAAFDKDEGELRAAGAWIRQKLDAAPGRRYAVICPDLDNTAEAVGRAVRDGLVPGWQFAGQAHSRVVNVSYGRRLADYPAVAVALKLLGWIDHGLTTRELSIMLRSRMLGAARHGDGCRLESRLRRLPDRAWTPDNLIEALAGSVSGTEPGDFLGVARAVAAAAGRAREPAHPAEWVQEIDELLRRCGWPGEEALGSRAFQLIDRWRELLNEFARTEAVQATLTLQEALRQIAAMAGDTIWQPEGDPSAPVQVMGVLEAAGLEFDGIWIAGMDAMNWPPGSRPSPYLHPALQRDHGMPDATPADTLAFARRVFDRLAGSAQQVVVSWSRLRGDLEVTGSSLLDDIDTRPYRGPADPERLAGRLAGPNRAAVTDGDRAPPVAPEEKLRGGAYTVQCQKAEPLAAFMQGRLGVTPLENIAAGLSAQTRGSIVHEALHSLLAGCPSHAALADWSPEERRRRIGSAVDGALTGPSRHADSVLRRLLEIERVRLMRLLDDFLAAETERAGFEIVALEKQVEYVAMGIRLDLRIDRIDRFPDGSLAVIDYKTGAPKSFLGKDGEPTDLQLIVYADALDETVGGLAFINVDSRAVSYRVAGGAWPKSKIPAAEWPGKLAAWKANVHAHLQDIARGDVRCDLGLSAAEARPLAIVSRIEELRRDN